MKLLESLKWPLTILVSLALIIVGGVLLAGPNLGVPEQTQMTVLTWVAGVGTLLAAPLTWLLAYLRRDTDGDGKPDWDDPAPRDPTNGGAAVLLVAIAVSGTLTSGCGAAWLDAHTPIAQAGQTVQIQSEPVIRQLRLRAIERAIREAHAGGATRAEAEAVRARVERDWQCPLAAHRGFGTLVSSYVDGLWLAERTGQEPAGGDGDGELGIMDFVPFARRLVDGYRAIAQCANTLSPGQLPVPAFLDLLPPTWGIDIGVREEADRG